MRKKVIFLLWRDTLGGIEVIIPSIHRELKKYELEVFVLRPRKGEKKSIFDISKIRINYGSNNNLILYLKLFSFLKKNRESVVHGFNVGPFLLFILRLAGIKRIVYSIHGTIYWKTNFQKSLRKIFWNFAVTKNVLFYSNSEYSKKVFLETISDKTKIKVIYNPFDTKRFNINKNSGYDINNLKICFLGRLSKSKNLFQWIDSAEKILSHFPNYEFNIYGEGPLKKNLIDYIKSKGLEQNIHFHSFRKDVENVYRENDLLLFLSEYESFGNVIVESVLCGTPIIASAIPSLNEILRDYTQFLIPLDENITDNVLEKIKKYSMLKNLALKVAREFREKFSLEKHIEELNRTYLNFE